MSKQLRKYEGTIAERRYYSNYIRSARKRHIDFALSQADFNSIISQPCFYCGSLPALRDFSGNLKGTGYEKKDIADRVLICNGVDRIKTTEPYTIENCVSCCGICNMAKFTLSTEEFLEHINNIYVHSIQNKTVPNSIHL